MGLWMSGASMFVLSCYHRVAIMKASVLLMGTSGAPGLAMLPIDTLVGELKFAYDFNSISTHEDGRGVQMVGTCSGRWGKAEHASQAVASTQQVRNLHHHHHHHHHQLLLLSLHLQT
eukprot:1147440-Pelagomonas_calceolata.AAC.2